MQGWLGSQLAVWVWNVAERRVGWQGLSGGGRDGDGRLLVPCMRLCFGMVHAEATKAYASSMSGSFNAS